MAKKVNQVAIMVTTAHKGVFFGYGQVTTEKTIRLEKVRMCIYWCNTKGVLGLANEGPNKSCRISPAASSVIIQDVVSLTEISPEAAAKWEEAPWG